MFSIPMSSVRGRQRSLALLPTIAALSCGAFATSAQAQQAADEAAPPTAPGTNGPTGPQAETPAGHQARDVTLNRPQVRRVQRNVGVRADGAFGSRSRAALKRWERRAAVPADGRPDTEVLRRMRIRLTAAQSTPSAAAERSSAPASGVQKAVDAAMRQSGTPYRSGGSQPGGFDCSGLTSWAFAQIGIELPRTSFEQYEKGTAVARDELQAGDLVFYDSAGPGASDVGIATGPTKVVSATTHGVMEHAAFDSYWGGHYVGARRLSAAG